jgi:hypothetical protein
MQNTSKGSTLTDRATTTKLLYNYLEYVSPADVDGIRKAYVTVGDKGVTAKPVPKNKAKIAEMYGKKPTLIADEQEPTALIPRISPQDTIYPEYHGFGDKLIRSALRQIVDEV